MKKLNSELLNVAFNNGMEKAYRHDNLHDPLSGAGRT